MATRDNPVEVMVDARIEQFLRDCRFCLEGVVVDYDQDTNTASIQPTQNQISRDASGERVVEQEAIIPRVPVEFLSAGGFSMVCPISTGKNNLGPATTGTLFFSQRALDVWKSSDGTQPLDPVNDRLLDPTDAKFVPGFRTLKNPIPNIATDHATLGADAGVRIHLFKDRVVVDQVQDGGATSGNEDFVALAGQVNKLLEHYTRVETVITGSTIDEPGMGAPSALQLALQAALTTPPPPALPTDVSAKSLKTT